MSEPENKATPQKSAQRRPRPAAGRPVANQRRRPNPGVHRLVETKGPDPETPLSDVRLTVGTLAGSHGVRGEIKLRLLTDRPEQLAKIKTVYLGDNPAPVRLLGYRSHGDQGLIRIEGVTTPERAKELSGTLVKIAGTDARPLEEGEYFLFQLMGLRARDEEGNELGVVTDLMETGAHDVLVISRDGGREDLLVPNHGNFVIEVAPDRGEIVLRPPVYSE